MKKLLFLTFGLSLFFLSIQPATILAWEMSPQMLTHQQINLEAMRVFESAFANHEKYQLGPVDVKSGEQYRGIKVASSSRFIDPITPGTAKYELSEGQHTMSEWIMFGGGWADEPHLYASVRHFYDPLKLSGVHYLTDQSTAHGLYDSPEIDALTWGLTHSDNPFSFKNALSYYKKAMEIPETGLPAAWLPDSHFKLNVAVIPKDRVDERNIYLAMAFRSLGESMHMLADLTQPAHVRNDSHPFAEPVEENVSKIHVIGARDNLVEPRIGQYLVSAGADNLLDPSTLFNRVALFTNVNFYSADTIYDSDSNEKPANWEKPYPSPQFNNFIVEETVFTYPGLLSNKTTLTTLYGAFINEKIPMAQEKLSYSVFKTGAAMQIYERLYHRYHIPPSFADGYAKVLMPVAIHACADLMHSFFPTMQLEADFDDQGVIQDVSSGSKVYERRVIEIDAEMLHLQDQDPAWKEMGLTVNYAGPGTLVFEENEKVTATRKLYFENRKVTEIEDYKGQMVKAPLKLYVKEGKMKLSDEESFYEIQKDMNVYLKIESGGRVFKSDVYQLDVLEEYEISIEPPRIVLYELVGDAKEVTHDFVANVKPAGMYRVEWDFGDGTLYAHISEKAGDIFKTSHSYENLKEGDKFYPEVKLFSEDGKTLLAKDSISITFASEEVDETAVDYVDLLHSFSELNLKLQSLDTVKKWSVALGESFETVKHGAEIPWFIPGTSRMSISWSGNSFIGTLVQGDPERVGRIEEVSGIVSADGTMIESIVFSSKTRYESTKTVMIDYADCEFKDIPLPWSNGIEARQTELRYSVYGPEAETHVVRLEYCTETIDRNNGEMQSNLTYISTDWSADPQFILFLFKP